jgi:hypothetical protein
MSATLSGPIALLSPHPIEGLSSSLEFDGQMWLGPGSTLTGVFRYYNSSNDIFGPVEQYIGWIHVSNLHTTSTVLSNFLQVAKFVPAVDSHLQTSDSQQFAFETEAGKTHTQKDGDSPASSQTVADVDIIHVVGDIIQVRNYSFVLTCTLFTPFIADSDPIRVHKTATVRERVRHRY